MKTFNFGLILIFSLFHVFFMPASLYAAQSGIASLITKIEGSGLAKVRRNSGTEVIAGVQQELFAGDKIITDENSQVEILLYDGSLIKMGYQSEYIIQKVEWKNGVLHWVFSLVRGSIRALVERSNDKDSIRFIVNTPEGTMGVRGTEFLLIRDPQRAETQVFTLHGNVGFGKPGCFEKKNCVSVSANSMANASLSLADIKKPEAFNFRQLLSTEKKDIKSSTITELLGVNDWNAKEISKKSEEEIDQMVKKSVQEFQDAQNALIGRSEEERLRTYSLYDSGKWNLIEEYWRENQKKKGGDFLSSIMADGASAQEKELFLEKVENEINATAMNEKSTPLEKKMKELFSKQDNKTSEISAGSDGDEAGHEISRPTTLAEIVQVALDRSVKKGNVSLANKKYKAFLSSLANRRAAASNLGFRDAVKGKRKKSLMDIDRRGRRRSKSIETNNSSSSAESCFKMEQKCRMQIEGCDPSSTGCQSTPSAVKKCEMVKVRKAVCD